MAHVQYCCVIWGKLAKFQKKSCQITFGQSFSTPSAFLFSELKWMPLPDTVIYHKALHLYTTNHGGAP